MTTLTQLLQTRPVFLDGGTGTLLQARGLGPGESPELWNLQRPHDLEDIHRAYYDAGSDLVMANTFGANPLKLRDVCPVEDTVTAALDNLRAARDAAGHGFLGLDIGPTGRLLAPLGDLDFDDAVASFRRVVEAGVKAGADAVCVETMTDLYELKAAVLAARSCCDLPVLATVAFDGSGRLLTGGDPAALVALLEGLGVTALGVNCGVGPIQLADTAHRLLELASVPVILKPNAGLPCTVDGCTHYDIDADTFVEAMFPLASAGARLLGGCCGTTPEHIRKLRARCEGLPLIPTVPKDHLLIASGSGAVDVRTLDLDSIAPISVPDDPDDLLDEVFDRQDEEEPVLRLDFSVGGLSPREAVDAVQSVARLPLWLEGADAAALEDGLRRINGKALVTVPAGQADVLLPLLRRFGGVAYDPDSGTLTDCKRI